jgi:hypothetical protein
MLFLDNIGIKGLKSRYNNKEVPKLLGVRRFILKYIQNLDAVLADLEKTKATISAIKLKFYITRLKIIKYIYNTKKRHPNSTKVLKILE